MRLTFKTSSDSRLSGWALALILVLWPVSGARAWGQEGHRVVAEIAEQFLEPDTAKQVRELLAIENSTTLADVSSWADYIRLQRRETGSWHYVNIPIHPGPNATAGYDKERDCPQDNCIVAQILKFEAVLKDRGAPPVQRLEALKFLVHFIGDVHQPLHCSDNNDRGGNTLRYKYEGRLTNLHAIWDTNILLPAVRGDERAYALTLVRSIDQKSLPEMAKGTVVDWANESYAIAVDVIYKNLPSEIGALSGSYGTKMLPIVDGQLKRAGVRLAMVLNGILGSH
jgi:hypothetical protein